MDGVVDGRGDGSFEGVADGCEEGRVDGAADGWEEGSHEGCAEACVADRYAVGAVEGERDRRAEG